MKNKKILDIQELYQLGIKVSIPNGRCDKCGCKDIALGDGKGPHAAGIICGGDCCPRTWKWLSKKDYASLQDGGLA